MKKVLWVSRHTMTESQFADLQAIYGEVELVRVDKTISTANELKDDIDNADVIAVVLPIGLLSDVKRLAGTKPVIRAISRRERGPEIDGETQYVFVHEYWEQIDKIVVETTRLSKQTED